MVVRGGGRLRVAAEARRPPVVPSGVLAMLIFVFCEIMFFAGLISGFAIIRGGAIVWPPPDQPRLPVEETAVNTAALLLSGLMLFAARRRLQADRRRVWQPLLASILLGVFFVVFQGVEWVGLIREGLTLTSSSLGSFFYLIVGLHALHAVIALGLLCYTFARLQRGWLARSQFAMAEVFWYFVVGLWPILYLTVYL